MAPPLPASRSTEIDKLAVALAKAQGAMEAAKRASENPGFKREGKNSRYADLASVWEAVREPLSSNGLSVVQLPTTLERGVEIETILLHESGQYLRNTLWMPCGQAMTVHTIGSAITYGRRYALMAIAGVAPEEDDGNSAAGVDDHKPGLPGMAGGGRDFRPSGPRRMPPAGTTNDWVADAERDGIVDHTREKGTLPGKAANAAPATAIKRAEWCKKAIDGFKDAQTKDELQTWWRSEGERLAIIESTMPAEYERLLKAFDAAIDRTAMRGA